MCCHHSTQYSNLYLLAMCRTNVNATAMLLFLHRLLDVFKHYFTEMEEESLRDNFVIAYELLDEVMDFGYPQARDHAGCKRPTSLVDELMDRHQFRRGSPMTQRIAHSTCLGIIVAMGVQARLHCTQCRLSRLKWS